MRIQTKRLYRQLLVAALLMGGSFNMTAPALAVGTAAGQSIKNQATATYEDPNDPNNTPINTTSNEVTVTVAEVAGIEVVSTGAPVDGNGGSVTTGDTLEFTFQITNTGNAATNFVIPVKSIVKQNLTITKVEADLDNNGSFEADITSSTENYTTSAINPDSSVKVKVTGTVNPTANVGDTVYVQLGNTPPNDNSASTQNQPNDGTADSDEVYTQDPTTGDNTDDPINGVREASAKEQTSVGAQTNITRAFATVLKKLETYTAGSANANDDKLTYRLDLRVESNSPNGSYSAGNLEGTTINVDGATAPRILVSDVIPTGTVFDPSIAPTAPVGWQVVYSTTAVTNPTDDALAAQWTTTQPATASDIKRVGFIYVGGASINKSTTTESTAGFKFTVVTSGMTAAGGNVANIAQVFGKTVGDTNNTVIYDESGDQNPNNFNGATDPYNDGAGGFDPNNDNGKVNPADINDPNTDLNNNNTGNGNDGELNVKAIPPDGTVVPALVTGPQSNAAATGPGISNNTDYTNKSVTNMLVKNTASFDPEEITFNNRFVNNGSNKIDNLILLPIPPSQADYVADNTATANQTNLHTGFGTDDDLKQGTRVTITYNSNIVIYDWNATTKKFDLVSGSVKVSNIQPGESNGFNYTVKVDLPSGTEQLKAFPITIAAYVEQDSIDAFLRSASSPSVDPFYNLTVNRAYTGYMKLVKFSQVLKGTGPDVGTGQGNFNTTPGADADTSNDVQRTPAPGNIIEYKITYTNISTSASAGGSGSVLLNAENFKIFEDGMGPNGDWGTNTSHVMGQAKVASGSTIKYYNATFTPATPGPGVSEATTNTGYIDEVGNVNAGVTGDFTFQRQLN